MRTLKLSVLLVLLVSLSLAGAGEVDFRLHIQPSLGDPNAPVKVVEFVDFKCPVCKIFYEQDFLNLERDYINTGKVEFFFLNFPLPLGDDSNTAAYAAECVYHQNEAAFWQFYRAILENQGPESQTWATPEFLLNLVKEHVQPIAPVDLSELAQCIAEKRFQKDVQEDRQLGVNAGVGGTPSIFVNGQNVSWFPYSRLTAVIDQELGKVRNSCDPRPRAYGPLHIAYINCNDSDDEVVIIVNGSNQDVNLKEYKIKSGGGQEFLFTETPLNNICCIIKSNGFLRIHSGPKNDQQFDDPRDLHWLTKDSQPQPYVANVWIDEGDSAKLLDSQGELVDTYEY